MQGPESTGAKAGREPLPDTCCCQSRGVPRLYGIIDPIGPGAAIQGAIILGEILKSPEGIIPVTSDTWTPMQHTWGRRIKGEDKQRRETQ